jgi:hypothetical protein
MRNLLIFAGLSVAAVAGGVELRATLKASETRAATAAAWSGDEAQFVAVGITNTTPVVAMPDQLDVVSCDVLIDSVVTKHTPPRTARVPKQATPLGEHLLCKQSNSQAKSLPRLRFGETSVPLAAPILLQDLSHQPLVYTYVPGPIS